MSDDDQLTVQDVGIGDDETESRLEELRDMMLSEYDHLVYDPEVESDVLSAVAHLRVVFYDDVDEPNPDILKEIYSGDFVIFYASKDNEGRLVWKVAPEYVLDVLFPDE